MKTTITTGIVSVALTALAVLAIRRRGRGRDGRVPAPADVLVCMLAPLPARPSTVDSGLNPVRAESPPSDASGTPAPTAPTAFHTVAVIDDDAPSDSRLSSGSSRRWKLPPHDDPRAESAIRTFARSGGPETEDTDDEETPVAPTTGFATRRAWNEAFRHEEHRFARYGCPVTLVVAEIDGLDSLAARLGQGAADRLIAPVKAVIRRNARAADVLARAGRTRFVALLPETDEIATINYVERVRCECDMWLEAGELAVRLAIGWAQPIAGGNLADALRLADDRMNADRRRQGFCTPAVTAVPLTHDQESPSSRG